MTMLELDERRRASMGKIGHKEHTLYRATTLEDGTIILTPAVVVSERELAVLRNQDRLASIKQGVKEALAGEAFSVADLGLPDADQEDEGITD